MKAASGKSYTRSGVVKRWVAFSHPTTADEYWKPNREEITHQFDANDDRKRAKRSCLVAPSVLSSRYVQHESDKRCPNSSLIL